MKWMKGRQQGRESVVFVYICIQFSKTQDKGSGLLLLSTHLSDWVSVFRIKTIVLSRTL